MIPKNPKEHLVPVSVPSRIPGRSSVGNLSGKQSNNSPVVSFLMIEYPSESIAHVPFVIVTEPFEFTVTDALPRAVRFTSLVTRRRTSPIKSVE